jgi:hypothetical protein
LENIKFLSIKFQDVESKIKLKKYKVYICLLWVITVSLFITLMYYNSLSKGLEKNINIRKSKAMTSQEEKVVKKFDTINNFIDFYNSSNNNEAFNEININDKQIMLNALIEEKSKFNAIVYNLEHSNYNIVYLSPVKDYNNKYSFKLTLEVKK